MTKWQLHDAKHRLSEVMRKARDEGPQIVTLRGADAVEVVAADPVRSPYQEDQRHPRRFLSRFAVEAAWRAITP